MLRATAVGPGGGWRCAVSPRLPGNRTRVFPARGSFSVSRRGLRGRTSLTGREETAALTVMGAQVQPQGGELGGPHTCHCFASSGHSLKATGMPPGESPEEPQPLQGTGRGAPWCRRAKSRLGPRAPPAPPPVFRNAVPSHSPGSFLAHTASSCFHAATGEWSRGDRRDNVVPGG